MKKTLLLIIALGFACSVQAQNAASRAQINRNIASYIKRSAHDPGSYQFVSTTLLDTLRRSHRIEKEVHKEVRAQKSRLNTYEMLMQGNDKVELAKTQAEIDKSRREIDSLTAVVQDMRAKKRADPSVGYLFIHQCRIRNAFGALVLKNYKVSTDKGFRIIALKELE